MAKFDDKPKKKKRKKNIKKDAGGNVVDASTGLTVVPDDEEIIQESKAYKPAKKTVKIKKIPIEPKSERLIKKDASGFYLGEKVKRSGPTIEGSDKRELPKNYVTTSSDEGYNLTSYEDSDGKVVVAGSQGENLDRQAARARHIRSEISKKLPQKDEESDLDYEKRIREEADQFIRNDPSLIKTHIGARKKGEGTSKELEDEFRNVYESKANIYGESEKLDPNAEAKEVLGENATEEDIADYNSSKQKEALPSQENKELGDEVAEGLSIKKALENEATQKATTKEELLQGRRIANEVAEETRREKRKREKDEKNEEKVKSPLILKILEKAPGIAKDMLVDLSMKDIFKVASQLGISDPKSKKERKNAEAYLDTVQKLGVQDYFPQVGENIAVGTFTGSRIGSQTIYSGAGGLAPMSLYDAKRRAMKAGLKSSTKSVENFMKFMQLPPVYNEDYINIATEAYNDIMSDSDLSSEERREKLNKLNNSGAQLMGAWNTVQNLQSRLLNTKNEEKESLYMPPAMKKKMYSIIENSMDPEYLKRAITGDVNLAKDASELSLFSDMIYVATESAKDFTGFKKKEGAEQFIDELTAAEKLELQQWEPGSGGTLATKPLIKKYVEFFAKDIDGVFNAIFKDEDGNIRDNFSEDQEEQAKKIFTEMLAPSFLEDMKTMSTGVTQQSMTGAERQKRKYIFSDIRYKNDLKIFKETGNSSTTKDEWADKLSGTGVVRTSSNTFRSDLGGGVLAIEKTAPNVELYLLGNKIRRPGGIKIRATVNGGGTELLTANDIKLHIASGKTVRAADLNGDVLTEDIMDRFIESSAGGKAGSTSAARYRLQAHSEAPTYYKNNVLHGIRSDADVADYNASNEQGMMWQDIAQPDYDYTTVGAVQTLQFPFYVQGIPYVNDEATMKDYDHLYETQSSQAMYDE